MKDELFPIVDGEGNVVGSATRHECHNGSMLLHPVVHLHILDAEGRILLQLRSKDKDIQPGKWDTAVGGHVDFGESVADALAREVSEELGLERECYNPVEIERYIFRSDRECELVNVFAAVLNVDISRLTPQPSEIDEIRFFNRNELEGFIGTDKVTPNFASEYKKISNRLEQLLPVGRR